MNEYNIKVNFNSNSIYSELKNLVKTDYNSTKLKFTFDKTGQRILFKLLYPDETCYVDEITNNILILPAGVLCQNGNYFYEISLYDENSKLTNYATGEFFVRSELVNTDEVVEPDDRVPILDELINETDQALQDVNTAIEETNNLDLDVSKEGKTATVTLTKKDATTKVVTLSDGTSLMFNWNGTSLGIKTDEDTDYTYVDLQGVQGEQGPMGAPFTIKKTYSSVAEMNADFNNMQVGDYVMITSNVEVEDNAKLYCKGTEAWIFITDFSGATGIQGPVGVTPNIQIGTVVSGTEPGVTRSGTNENPVLNFTLVKGDTGATGETGATGNGIASIEKTATAGLVDTYTITYTNGTTSTFTITNGEVSQAQLDYVSKYANALIKNTNTGTSLTINDTVECPMPLSLAPSEVSQDTLPSEYTAVDYMESVDEGSYIDTGLVLTQDNAVEIKISLATQYTSNRMVFGSRSDASVNNISINARSNIAVDFNNSSYADYRVEYSYSANTPYILYTGKDKRTIYDANRNVLAENNTLCTDTITTPETVRINAINPKPSNTWYFPKMKTYYCRIYNNGVLVKNMIPCYRNSDNEVGLYDTVNDVFYTNAGTGSFTYGAVATLPNPDMPLDIHVITGNNTIIVSNSDNTASQSFPLNLGDLTYCKGIGNYVDRFFKNVPGDPNYSDTREYGKWYLKRLIKKYTFTGNESFIKAGNGFQSAAAIPTGVATRTSGNFAYMNTYKYAYYSSSVTTNIKDYEFSWSASKLLTMGNNNYNNATDFAHSLTGSIMYFPLATSEYILLDETLQSQLENIYNWALSYETQTNITQTNADLPFIITATTIEKIQETNLSNYLAKDNTTSYTPTGDYNPATKKYVDDAITSAITTTLGGEY